MSSAISYKIVLKKFPLMYYYVRRCYVNDYDNSSTHQQIVERG
jgi:hypothetical protein